MRSDHPDPILILGTDAAGKDHLANLLIREYKAAGRPVEARKGWFSEPPRPETTTTLEDKSRAALAGEAVFLKSFRANRVLIPAVLTLLVRRDLRAFRHPGTRLIVVSHTGLRVLAFYLGHRFPTADAIRVPAHLDRALRAIPRITRARTVALDIDDAIRQTRIARRRGVGKMDPFDRYMAGNSHLSERIEGYLVRLGQIYLDAVRVENNDLSDAELLAQVERALER